MENKNTRETEENKFSPLRSKIAQNLTDIESRDDLTADEKANKLIQIFSATCAGVAIQPIPFADIFILTPIQMYMAERLCAVRGIPIQESSVLQIVAEAGKVIALGVAAQQAAIVAYKTFLPGLGGFMTIPLVYSLTYGIGKVLDHLIVSRAKGHKLSSDEIKNIWSIAKEEGKTKGKQQRENIKNKDNALKTSYKTGCKEDYELQQAASIQAIDDLIAYTTKLKAKQDKARAAKAKKAKKNTSK